MCQFAFIKHVTTAMGKQQASVGTVKRWTVTHRGMFSQTLEDGEAAAGSSCTAAQLPEASAFANRTLLTRTTLNTPVHRFFNGQFSFYRIT